MKINIKITVNKRLYTNNQVIMNSNISRYWFLSSKNTIGVVTAFARFEKIKIL